MKVSQRQSNIELLRIFTMLMIVSYHFAIHGVIQQQGISPYEMWASGPMHNIKFTMMLMPGGEVGVGLFFVIAGYFNISKETVNLKRVLLEMFFYAVSISVLAVIIYNNGGLTSYNTEIINENNFNAIFFPISSKTWWFATAYVMVMLISPVFNRFFNRLNAKGVIVVILIMSLYWHFHLYETEFFLFDFARGLTFYAIGAGIKKYTKPLKGIRWFADIACGVILWFVSYKIWFDYSVYRYLLITNHDLAVASRTTFPIMGVYSCIIVPFIVFFIFKFFESIRIENSRIINTVAKTTFGIYLLHDNDYFRVLIWKDLVDVSSIYFVNGFIVKACVYILCVFIVCVFFDSIRMFVIEPGYMYVYDRISRKTKEWFEIKT